MPPAHRSTGLASGQLSSVCSRRCSVQSEQRVQPACRAAACAGRKCQPGSASLKRSWVQSSLAFYGTGGAHGVVTRLPQVCCVDCVVVDLWVRWL